MNKFKKIFITILCLNNLIIFTSDEHLAQREIERKKREQQYVKERQQPQKSTAIWTGVAGIVGAVTGTAVGYWLANLDNDYQPNTVVVENSYSYDSDEYEALNPKARQVKSDLDKLAKYGQFFDLHDNEQVLISNLHKLGFKLHEIDTNFYHQLAQENKALNDAGYSIWWHGLKSLEAQKNSYLLNSKKMIAYFNRHENFIQSCQIINSYDALPLTALDLPSWIRVQYHGKKRYPLIAYKEKIELDRQFLMKLQRNSWAQYPLLVEVSQATKRTLDHAIEVVYGSEFYQREIDQKRQEELLERRNCIEQERLEVAKREARALEEANRLAAERNRIERERNKNYRDDQY